ncbi:unnamed protein product, partial [Didymodactylos carnosus]
MKQLLDVHKDDGTAILSYTASQRTIERKRKKDDIPLPRPTSFEDISIPQQLIVTNGGDRFLLNDNEDSDNRTIILSSDDDLNRLSNSEHWHADAPHLFYQLYIIHGFICGRSIPLVYARLPGKSEAVYGEVFNILVKNVNKHPKSITIDFEKAVENVIKQKLPTITISGCFFHFKQALWRKIQVHFVDYFEDNYIVCRIRNNRRRVPRFPITSWSCFSRLDQELPSTNNSSEGWHHALKNSVRIKPSIYESIKDLQVEQHASLIMAEKLEAGLVKLTKRA